MSEISVGMFEVKITQSSSVAAIAFVKDKIELLNNNVDKIILSYDE